MSLRSKERFFEVPSSKKSRSSPRERNAEMLTESRKRKSNSSHGQDFVVASILVLLCPRSPLAIAGFVPAIIVNSLYRKFRGTIAHIFQECVKRIYPFFTDSYTSTSIIVVSGMFWIGASLNQIAPTLISSGGATSNRMAVFNRSANNETSTRPGVFSDQIAVDANGFFSAFAETQAPSSMFSFVDKGWSVCDDFKLAEDSTYERYSFRHNESLRFCLAVRYSLSGEFHRDHFITILRVSQIFT